MNPSSVVIFFISSFELDDFFASLCEIKSSHVTDYGKSFTSWNYKLFNFGRNAKPEMPHTEKSE